MGTDDPSTLAAVEFEVYGQVQGFGIIAHIISQVARLPIEDDLNHACYILDRFPSGCYFTKYCKELAEQLGILGYVKNSKKGTIVGKIQGHREQLDHMIDWLSTTGSPGCKIEKCELTNWEYSTKWGYTDFSIRF